MLHAWLLSNLTQVTINTRKNLRLAWDSSQGRPLADWTDCSNWAPRQRGPRATSTNLHKLTLSIEAAHVVPARDLHAVFFKREICCQRKPKWIARC